MVRTRQTSLCGIGREGYMDVWVGAPEMCLKTAHDHFQYKLSHTIN